ncbi:hypothetical protein [Nisaea sp.]|uniref:hypothetical protein n=1 Tax=Nisaea sp. TaxID=2024842 RepID=UPI0032636B95
MRTLRNVVAGAMLILLSACATPPEVKQLSTAQIQYFDTAIQAVATQSEALVLASTKIQKQAEERIAKREADSNAQLVKLLSDSNKGDSTDERKSLAEKVLTASKSSAKSAADARAKLQQDLDAIKAKSEELGRYIATMKDVQIALDAYIQSEKAGEKIVSSVLGQPSVSHLIDKVQKTIPNVTGAANDLKLLLSGLGG